MKKRNKKQYFLIPGANDFYSENVGIVEADLEISLAVQCLNFKGYKTIASCAGHNDRNRSGTAYGYIWLKTLPDAKLPRGFYSEPSGGQKGGHCIRWIAKTPRSLKSFHTQLLNWVHRIPYVE